MWNDNSLVRPRSLPGYCFDPTNVDYSTNKDPNVADDQRMDEEARKATEQHNPGLHIRHRIPSDLVRSDHPTRSDRIPGDGIASDSVG